MALRAQTRALQGSARVLVVSSDASLGRLVELTLNHGRYHTRVAGATGTAREDMDGWRPHLAIVDIDLRDGSGLDLVRSKRKRDGQVPLIALTQRGDLKTKLAAFEAGVDDIVTLPFIPEELVARVLALMRRTYGEAIPFIPVIEVGGLKIDLLNQQVSAGSSALPLTGLEQALLYLFASNPGRTISREEILDGIWGADFIAESNLVDSHVRNLRLKLKDDWRRPTYIATVPGKGYRFIAPSG
jgi:DNA-binding response OmpR family regulator